MNAASQKADLLAQKNNPGNRSCGKTESMLGCEFVEFAGDGDVGWI
jgi:hypothetical protein